MLSLEQALGAAPSLAALQERIRKSQRCMEYVKHLIPLNLSQHVQPGPIEDKQWCLMVGSASASTKLRQLVPVLIQVLNQKGMGIESIRIKVQVFSR